jgi:hypothetical protein
MAAKSKAKKSAPAKKASPAKSTKKAPPKKATKAKVVAKAPPAKKPAKAVVPAKTPLKAAEKSAGPAKTGSEAKGKVEVIVDKKRAKAEAAMEAALADGEEESAEDEEFDPEKFFALNGGQGLIKSHVMRKERVDLNVSIRYRYLKGPLVYSADLLNLSKGGLALKTEDIIKAKTVIKIEIPLPHTSELFAVQAEVIWSAVIEGTPNKDIHTGLHFLPMSLAKQAVINQFIQQRRDEVIMAKIGLDRFTDSVPVAGLD